MAKREAGVGELGLESVDAWRARIHDGVLMTIDRARLGRDHADFFIGDRFAVVDRDDIPTRDAHFPQRSARRSLRLRREAHGEKQLIFVMPCNLEQRDIVQPIERLIDANEADDLPMCLVSVDLLAGIRAQYLFQ